MANYIVLYVCCRYSANLSLQLTKSDQFVCLMFLWFSCDWKQNPSASWSELLSGLIRMHLRRLYSWSRLVLSGNRSLISKLILVRMLRSGILIFFLSIRLPKLASNLCRVMWGEWADSWLRVRVQKVLQTVHTKGTWHAMHWELITVARRLEILRDASVAIFLSERDPIQVIHFSYWQSFGDHE